MIELGRISGIGEYETENRTENQKMQVIYRTPGGRAFLVDRGNTIEVRSERNLAGLLREKYESVMESR